MKSMLAFLMLIATQTLYIMGNDEQSLLIQEKYPSSSCCDKTFREENHKDIIATSAFIGAVGGGIADVLCFYIKPNYCAQFFPFNATSSLDALAGNTFLGPVVAMAGGALAGTVISYTVVSCYVWAKSCCSSKSQNQNVV